MQFTLTLEFKESFGSNWFTVTSSTNKKKNQVVTVVMLHMCCMLPIRRQWSFSAFLDKGSVLNIAGSSVMEHEKAVRNHIRSCRIQTQAMCCIKSDQGCS